MRSLSIGLMLPNSSPLATGENIEIVAAQAEALGFDSVWLGDHVVMPRQVASYHAYTPDGSWPGNPDAPRLEPIITLTWIASRTRRLRIGLSVLVVPYRNPLVAAKMLATLDALSGGRLTVGCGAGWLEEEFAALNLDTFAERGEVTDECLRIYKAIWTEPVPQFSGRFFRFANVTCDPKPVQRPHPPLWIGGNTSRAVRRAAELGDGWQPLRVDLPTFASLVQELREQAAQRGRDPDALTVSLRVTVDPFGAGAGDRTPNPDDARTPLRGSPDAVAEGLGRYVSAGARDLIVEFRRTLPSLAAWVESMDWVIRELKPRLAAT